MMHRLIMMIHNLCNITCVAGGTAIMFLPSTFIRPPNIHVGGLIFYWDCSSRSNLWARWT